jgi:hypothetical protein
MQAMAEVAKQGLYPNLLVTELVPLGSGAGRRLTHPALLLLLLPRLLLRSCMQAMAEVAKQGLYPNPLVTELVPLGSGADALLTHRFCSASAAVTFSGHGRGGQAGPVPQPVGD